MYGQDQDGRCSDLARGVQFAIDNYWDEVYGVLLWSLTGADNPDRQKIVYGLFAIYVVDLHQGLRRPGRTVHAEKCFDLANDGAETS